MNNGIAECDGRGQYDRQGTHDSMTRASVVGLNRGELIFDNLRHV
jgi:hypothetical protein